MPWQRFTPLRGTARSVFALALAAGALVGVVLLFGQRHKQPVPMLPTYFTYDDGAARRLQNIQTARLMSASEARAWEEKAFSLVSEEKVGSVDASKIYAYLLAAQRDAAHLSHNATGAFYGSLAPVSRAVLCVFFTRRCPALGTDADTDEYSAALAETVLARIEERIARDQAGRAPYAVKTGEAYWKGVGEFVGLDAGSWETWLIARGGEFRAPAPPEYGSPLHIEELGKVNRALAGATEEQKKAVVFWAGGPGTKTFSGQWLEIASRQADASQFDLGRLLEVRALLAMAVADATIAVFDSKYSYWVKRPFMMDASLRTVMPTPNHPSYPGNHAAVSAAAEVILTYYFPDQAERFKRLAQEATDSRVWGGIHYPMDEEAGTVMGQAVGYRALERFR